jgi:hypothetical protein
LSGKIKKKNAGKYGYNEIFHTTFIRMKETKSSKYQL